MGLEPGTFVSEKELAPGEERNAEPMAVREKRCFFMLKGKTVGLALPIFALLMSQNF